MSSLLASSAGMKKAAYSITSLGKLVPRFCTKGEKRNPSKEATSLCSPNGKTAGLSASPRKEARQLADVAACQPEVH